jgi:PAS domain S-box-containing protein
VEAGKSAGTEPRAEQTPPHRQGAHFLGTLLNAVQHPLIAVDKRERITFWNRHATALYGFTEEEAMGRVICEVTAPNDAGPAREILSSVLKGATWSGEFPVTHRNGSTVQARVQLFPIVAATGEVTGAIGVSEDISEEIAARQELQLARDRFDLLARSTFDAIWDWDVQTDYLWCNEAYRSLVGPVTDGQSARQEWFARVHPEDRDRVMASLRNPQLEFHNEYRLLNYATGEYAPVLDRGFFLRDSDGQLNRVLGAMTDISHLKDIESAFRASEERFRLVFEESPIGIMLFDAGFRIVQSNPAMGQMLDFPTAELAGRSVIDMTHPDDRSACRRSTADLFTGENPYFRIEKRFLRRDGATLWAAVSATTIPGDAARPQLGLALLEDITEQRRVQEELAEAQRRATAAVDAKMRFLAQISHEFRSPMNGVLGMLELLDTSALNEEQSSYVSSARVAATALLGMLEDVLDLTRLNEQRVTLHPVVYSPRELVEKLITIFRPRAASRRVTLTCTVDATVGNEHLADAARLRQILNNLLDNAIKFTSEGCVQLSVDVRGDLLRFRVQDTGIGIPAAELESVFEAFSSLSAHTSASVGGTGLGLAISRQLARLMGGELTVDSTLGNGARFTLTVPAAGQQQGYGPDAAAHAAEPFSEPLTGRRVLVVEDNAINQRVAAGMLRRLQCEVDVAGDGVEALRLAVSGNYDAILMDAMMPVMDGFESTAEIRRREPAGRHTPIIGLTALATDEDQRRCLEAGMDDYIAKPANLQTLNRILRRWL